MHHHGYLWIGPKMCFDDEALRRPPPVESPTATSSQEVIQRHRQVVSAFPVSDLPPTETAHWLLKPASLARGTWHEPRKAALWLGEQLAEHASAFDSNQEREDRFLALLVNSAIERLGWGGDVSHGFYLARPRFISLAVVSCSPNRALPLATCPLDG